MRRSASYYSRRVDVQLLGDKVIDDISGHKSRTWITVYRFIPANIRRISSNNDLIAPEVRVASTSLRITMRWSEKMLDLGQEIRFIIRGLIYIPEAEATIIGANEAIYWDVKPDKLKISGGSAGG